MNRVVPTLALFLFLAFGATAQTTNGLSQAQIQGQQLAQELLSVAPVTNFTQTGILSIRNKAGTTTNVPLVINTTTGIGYWATSYPVGGILLTIIHQDGLTNQYRWTSITPPRSMPPNDYHTLGEVQITAPFANSDFWICDLGLEFFHWPQQKVLKHETRRTRACAVLESTNPHPSPGGYSKVVSWIDDETLGIVHAQAYDAKGKLLKEFDPKSFKKVNGQWELQDMEIQNVQTRSRTWIKFDLK